MVGGVIGVFISYLTAMAVNAGGREGSFLGMYFSEEMKVMIPWWLGAAALLVALTVGILSGIYPAYKTTKMSALDAMRKLLTFMDAVSYIWSNIRSQDEHQFITG